MLNAISAAQVAMNQDQLKMQAVSQNISNMQTPAYQRFILTESGFDEHLAANIENISKKMRQNHLQEQGTLTQTHRPLDVAISGRGYFQVQTENGVFYTRRGDFHINERGELTTASSALVLGKNGPVHIDEGDFIIDRTGHLFIDKQKIDQLNVVDFKNDSSLSYAGHGLYQCNTAPEPVNSATYILQGFVEQSNVKSIDEMTEMLKISRHFEASQKIMRMADALISSAVNQLGEGNV
ncbi:flagellar hook-basal body protein [Legionella israelensis]|uniref:Flagellar basal body rod protein FlgF n=1 Tax=Legionella israelensis TaxID=454 RepID=A0A0W0VYK5_9GAMM|nr:flagellar hook-basal body protein [Legionella israelensis]KTD24990.1 flagellar basal body rod protein FlgF [Legionella israelensis]QBR83999.1 flagellar hook-basal body protein [Legionella israelensis]QBS10884.1 flagellar hook-basal body protein [Legionella israelensis]SCX80454.1 flagellar basal-body rod protein FlgG [Legionella israelensis DSM 19235]STX57868.1 flagellar basal-body rod protein FlgF [Legionella israelensis]